MVETSVFPSPVFISATIPRCSAAAPMICTSKCRWPSTRLAASRTVAKASTWSSSRLSPAALRLRNSVVLVARSWSLSASNCGSTSLTAATMLWNCLSVLPSPARRTLERIGIGISCYRWARVDPLPEWRRAGQRTSMRPSRCAQVTASNLDLRPSLSRTLRTWLRTVFSEMYSSAAISFEVLPALT